MKLGTAQIIQGNALNLPLPDASVDLICTSPPYFGLRSYQDAGVHYDGQIGSEATPVEFLDALLAATREMVRVLKPSGSIFVNLGDKYAGGSNGDTDFSGQGARDGNRRSRPGKVEGIRPKSLMGIPWRYAIRCIDELGLILRAEIIWNKPNGLPESVTDRVRRSHEQWFHFVRQPRYFSAVDEIREEHQGRLRFTPQPLAERTGRVLVPGNTPRPTPGPDGLGSNPLGKLPGSVWQIPTQPLTVPPELGVDHFAAYPMEWPRRIIMGWTPNGICTLCGEGRRPVGTEERTPRPTSGPLRGGANRTIRDGHPGTNGDSGNLMTLRTITGYVCGCTRATEHQFAAFGPDQDARWTTGGGWRSMRHTRPAVVLDPFGGTGTTALVAKALGRTGITIDLSNDYCRLARWRCNDPRELAAALQVEKPDPVHPDQLDLFSGIE